MRQLFYVIFLLFLANTILAQKVLVLQNISDAEYVGKYATILEDQKGILCIENILHPKQELLWLQSTNEVPNFQITPFTYWLKLCVQNNSNKQYLLQIDKGDIDSLSFYAVQADSLKKTLHLGQLVPFQNRIYPLHQFVIPLELPTKQVMTFYIRVKSVKPLAVPLLIQEINHSIWTIYKQNILQGLYFGFVLLIILYNLFIWFSVRDKLYLIYVCYVAMLSIVLADFKGITSSLLFVHWEEVNPYLLGTYGIAGSLANIFSIVFLNTKTQSPKNHRVLVGIIVCYWISAIAGFTGFRLFSCLTVNVIAMLSSCYLLYTATRLYQKGFKPAKFYLYAFGSFLFCVLVQFGGNLGLLPANAFTLQAMQFGSAAEMLLLSLALADKINSLKIEKEQAKTDLLEVLQKQNIILEENVAKRTYQLTENNAILEVQNEEIKQQHEELLAINEALENQRNTTDKQKKIIEETLFQLQETSKRLNASISYAQNIQSVILPDSDLINNFFSNHFVIYSPKDVVSGDFYWFCNLQADSNKYPRALFALADCTGHGVSGAFMTMVCNALLYESVEIAKIESPAQILQNLDIRIQKILRQKEGKNSDGLDISLCLFEQQTDNKVQIAYAGANSYIYYVDKTTKELIKLASERTYIGGNAKQKIEFSNQVFCLEKQEMLYFTTDGYADQNDVHRNRLGLQKMRTTILEASNLSLQAQKQKFLDVLATHQQNETQRDDISFIGLQI